MIPDNPGPLLIAVLIGELLIIVAGIVIILGLVFTKNGQRVLKRPSRLATWEISFVEFLLAGGALIAACLLVLTLTGLVVTSVDFSKEVSIVIAGVGSQIGLLAGAYAAAHVLRSQNPKYSIEYVEPVSEVDQTTNNVWLPALLVFLCSIPILQGVGLVWPLFLQYFELSMEKQEILYLFKNAESASVTVILTIMAVGIAPLTEELIFRAGIFRFLKTRISPRLAYVFPAILFAAMHQSIFAFLPLFILGMIFAYAYERTGNIRVPIIAHALFNLHTILLLLSGVGV